MSCTETIQSRDFDQSQPVNSYCQTDGAAESAYIRVRRSVVDPKEASDSYGRRLGRRFVVFEITVENKNPSLQYMLHDVSVDLSSLHHLPRGTYRWAFSGQDLIMLRGVPEKGADLDPRNLTFHLMRGTGAVAGGVSGLVAPGIQELYSGATAAFNGPLLTSFIDIFPDHTATQLNRLSDSAFTANTVVAKESSKTFAIFVPEGLFMTHAEQNAYWKEPISVLETPAVDFRKADVCVDGAFISEVAAVGLTSATYDAPLDAVQPGVTAPVTVKGTNLVATDIILHAFDKTFPLTSVDADGMTGHASVAIPGDWNFEKDASVYLENKKTGQITLAVSLVSPVAPLLTSVDFFSDAEKGKAAAAAGNSISVKLKVVGQRLVADDTELVFPNAGEPLLGSVAEDRKSAEATVILPSKYDPKSTCSVALKSKRTGLLSQSATLKAAK